MREWRYVRSEEVEVCKERGRPHKGDVCMQGVKEWRCVRSEGVEVLRREGLSGGV